MNQRLCLFRVIKLHVL